LEIEDIEKLCLGDLQMTPDEMNQFDLRELFIKIKGHFNNLDETYKTSWEQARFVAYYSVMPHTAKNSQLKPTDLIKFDWDKKGKKRDLTFKDYDMMSFMDEMVRTKSVGE
jgi:hypothetical protein